MPTLSTILRAMIAPLTSLLDSVISLGATPGHGVDHHDGADVHRVAVVDRALTRC